VYPAQGSALALLGTIASTPPPRAQNAGFLTEPIGRMLDPNPDFRWSMGDAAHILRRLHERHAREQTRHSTSAFLRRRQQRADVAAVAPVVEEAASEPADDGPAADGPSSDARPSPPPEDRRRRPVGGRLMLLGVAGLLALAAVAAFLLWHDGSPSQPSASTHHKPSATRSGPSPRSSSSSPPVTDPTSGAQPVAGASGPRFVRDYYAVLPSGTASAWNALSPGFQAKIGGYGNYRGFWSTIASVSVRSTTVAQSGSVDVSLTYRGNDGRVSSEVRRLYLERHGSSFLITGDAVVG
jgi:hypothetical protein